MLGPDTSVSKAGSSELQATEHWTHFQPSGQHAQTQNWLRAWPHGESECRPEIQKSKNPEILESKNPKIQKSRNPKIQKSENPEIQKSRNPKIQKS